MAWQIPRPREPFQVPTSWMDVTSTIKQAASGMASGDLVMSKDTTLKDCMNAMELMDPKMDAAAFVADHTPVAAQLESGELSLDLPQGGVEAVADTLLRMLMSWFDGNSVLQTTLACKFAHPAALQSLRVSLGLPLYAAATEPDTPSKGKVTVPDPATVPAHCRTMQYLELTGEGAVPAASAPLAPGSQAATRRRALLALTTALTKTVDLCRRVVVEGDIYDDEDFAPARGGLDLAYTLTFDETLALLMDAETAVVASTHPDAAPVRGGVGRKGPLPGGFTHHEAADAIVKGFGLLPVGAGSNAVAPGSLPPTLTGVGGGEVQCGNWFTYYTTLRSLLAPAVAPLLRTSAGNSLRNLTAVAVQGGWLPPATGEGAPDLTITGTGAGAAPPAPPTVDLAAVLDAGVVPPGLAALQAFAGQGDAAAAAAEAAVATAHTAPSTGPVEALGEGEAASLLHRLRLARYLMQAYVCMHNGLDGFCDNMTLGLPVLGRAAGELAAIAKSCPQARAEGEDSHVGVPPSVPGFDLDLNRHLQAPAAPRFSPLPSYSAALQGLAQHLVHVGQVISARVLVATPIEALDQATPGLTVPVYPPSPSADTPLVRDTLAGAMGPAGCPPGGFTTVSGPGLTGEGDTDPTSAWRNLREADGRPAVTLKGVLDFLDSLSLSGANCVVRSMAAMLVLQTAPSVKPLQWETEAGEEEAVPDAGVWVMGTHTPSELATSFLGYGGLLPEYAALDEAQPLLRSLLPQVLVGVVRVFSHTLSRRRRVLRPTLRDLQVLLNQCEALDEMLFEFFVQSLTGVPTRNPVSGKPISPEEDAAGIVTAADITKVSVPPEVATVVGQLPPRQRGHALHDYTAVLKQRASTVHTQRLSFAALWLVTRVQRDYVLASLADDLLASHELPAAMVTLDALEMQLLQAQDRCRTARAQAGAHLAVLRKKGGAKKRHGIRGVLPSATLLPPLSSLPPITGLDPAMQALQATALVHRGAFTLLIASHKAHTYAPQAGTFAVRKGHFMRRYEPLLEFTALRSDVLVVMDNRRLYLEVEKVVRKPAAESAGTAALMADKAVELAEAAQSAVQALVGSGHPSLSSVGSVTALLRHGWAWQAEEFAGAAAAAASLAAAAKAAAASPVYGKKADVVFGLVAGVEERQLNALRKAKAEAKAAEDAKASPPPVPEAAPPAAEAAPSTVTEAALARAQRRAVFMEEFESLRGKQKAAVAALGIAPPPLHLEVGVAAPPTPGHYQHPALKAPSLALAEGALPPWATASAHM